MLKKWLVLLFTTTILLAACHSPVYNQTEGNVAEIKNKTVAARHKSDDDAKTQPSLVVKKGLYVDTTPVSLVKPPAWLENRIVIRGDQLPFSYYSRTIAAGASTDNVLTKYQTGLDPAARVSISYSGPIKGALDLLASKTGYVYSIQNNSVYWQAFVTKTYDIAFMPGGTDYLMGKSGGGTSNAASAPGTSSANFMNSDSSDSEYSSLKGKLNLWTDLESSIKQLLSEDGKVFVSESTTSVMVRDRPNNVAMISQFIANLNHNLSKQVLVKIQILDINLSSGYDFGINWALIAQAFHNSPFVLNGNYGTPVSITALTAQPNDANGNALATPQFGTQKQSGTGIPGWTILFNALNQQGKTAVVSEPRVVCLNNQVSVIRIVNQVGYVASVQNTSLAGSSSGGSNTNIGTVTSQVTPGTVITGLTLYLLPKILGKSIYLQVNADLSLNNNFSTFGSGSTKVQLPNITEKHFNQRSKIRSGDTLVLSGFRQVGNQTGANQFLTSQALGGQGAQQANVETIILITPIILDGSA